MAGVNSPYGFQVSQTGLPYDFNGQYSVFSIYPGYSKNIGIGSPVYMQSAAYAGITNSNFDANPGYIGLHPGNYIYNSASGITNTTDQAILATRPVLGIFMGCQFVQNTNSSIIPFEAQLPWIAGTNVAPNTQIQAFVLTDYNLQFAGMVGGGQNATTGLSGVAIKQMLQNAGFDYLDTNFMDLGTGVSNAYIDVKSVGFDFKGTNNTAATFQANMYAPFTIVGLKDSLGATANAAGKNTTPAINVSNNSAAIPNNWAATGADVPFNEILVQINNSAFRLGTSGSGTSAASSGCGPETIIRTSISGNAVGPT